MLKQWPAYWTCKVCGYNLNFKKEQTCTFCDADNPDNPPVGPMGALVTLAIVMGIILGLAFVAVWVWFWVWF